MARITPTAVKSSKLEPILELPVNAERVIETVSKNKEAGFLSSNVPETNEVNVPISNETQIQPITNTISNESHKTKMDMDPTIVPPPSTTAEPHRNQDDDIKEQMNPLPLDMKCICGTKMRVFAAKAFIDWNNIWCTLCTAKIDPKHSLYFCSLKSKHPDGYYLCNDCAVTKRIRAQIQRGYELNCELIRRCGGTVRTDRADDRDRGVRFPCKSSSCDICGGRNYNPLGSLYFKPTPWKPSFVFPQILFMESRV